MSIPDVLDLSVDDIISHFESGTYTSQDLVETYLLRIEQINSLLKAVIEINPRARSIAKELDLERKSGHVRGPLHGVPILIKDNLATDASEGMSTTTGSYALVGAQPPSDSTIAVKLRQAGAVIIGKTNLSQWSNYRGKDMANGWSSRGGQCIGAYYPNQDPSGSSSGSGVAVSVGLAAVAIGTETEGSIICPSEANGIVGIKPSLGLTSRYLGIPISEHQDTVGPMTRNLKDAAYVLAAIAGKDPKDSYTSAISFSTIPDYVGACRRATLVGKRIGVPRNGFVTQRGCDTTEIHAAFDRAMEAVQKAGAIVVDPADFPDMASFTANNNDIMGPDFIAGLATYFSQLKTNPNDLHNLHDLVKFTKELPAEEFPARNIGKWEEDLQSDLKNTDPKFLEMYETNLKVGSQATILGALERENLDVLMIPSIYSPHYAAPAGYPVITIPLGQSSISTPVKKTSDGLVEAGPKFPFAISFYGRKFDEAGMIEVAYAFELMWKEGRGRPLILPNIEIRDVLNMK